MARTPTVAAVRSTVAAGLAVLAAVATLLLTAGPAHATGRAAAAGDGPGSGPRVHHVYPEHGAVLRASPDHVEIMFDVAPVPGGVEVGVAPDATGRLIDLPGPPVLDGPLVVQPLPTLAAGRYTVGVRIRAADGRVHGGTFGFAVDPTAPDATAEPGPTGAARWLVPAVGAALLLPAAALARRRRRRSVVTRRPAAPAPARPGRAAGRTPTSASSPGDPPGR